MKIKSIYTLLVTVALLAAALGGCSSEHEVTQIERPVVEGVMVETITPKAIAERYEASGTVAAKTVSAISSRVMGTVTAVKVKEGDRVRAGQVLLVIDARDLSAKVTGAESAYNEAMKALGSATEQRDLAQKTYERYKSLHEQNALSTQELDNMLTQKNVAEHEYQRVEAMVKRAKAGLREASVYKGFATIASPIDGIVSSKTVDTGNMASPGMPLMMIEDDSSYRVEAAVDERFLNTMITGMAADISVGTSANILAGKVVEVVPSVDPISRTFMVKLDVEGSGLRSGQYVKVAFSTGTKESLLVPIKSVVRKGQLTGVYRVDSKGLVIYRLVKTGKMHGQSVEILSGIMSGDMIVVDNVDKAIDGGVMAGAPAGAAEPGDKESAQ